jgi:hypothetical protein
MGLLWWLAGVIIESEDLHRQAYNATFKHFNVRCNGTGAVVEWTEEFYNDLQNRIGGGKPKMRWYFGAFDSCARWPGIGLDGQDPSRTIWILAANLGCRREPCHRGGDI